MGLILFVRFPQSNLIIGLISIELGCMISMTRCLIRYVGYTGNSLLASTECICKHNVIVTNFVMNRTINEGSLPAGWKHAIITPVHKTGSKSDPSNFRPISVLPIFSKILERAVHRMVYSYLQEHRLLSPLQSGFLPLHSTSTCLAHVTNTLLENIDKRLLTGLIFLDLSKAFD